MSNMSLPNSLWAATAVPAADTPPLKGERSADAVASSSRMPMSRDSSRASSRLSATSATRFSDQPRGRLNASVR